MTDKKKSPASANPWPKRLKKLRALIAYGTDQPEITQAELAKRLRVTVRSVNKWENGWQVPSPPHQLLIEFFEEKYA